MTPSPLALHPLEGLEPGGDSQAAKHPIEDPIVKGSERVPVQATEDSARLEPDPLMDH
jgi:hypothetical protein